MRKKKSPGWEIEELKSMAGSLASADKSGSKRVLSIFEEEVLRLKEGLPKPNTDMLISNEEMDEANSIYSHHEVISNILNQLTKLTILIDRDIGIDASSSKLIVSQISELREQLTHVNAKANGKISSESRNSFNDELLQATLENFKDTPLKTWRELAKMFPSHDGELVHGDTWFWRDLATDHPVDKGEFRRRGYELRVNFGTFRRNYFPQAKQKIFGT